MDDLRRWNHIPLWTTALYKIGTSSLLWLTCSGRKKFPNLGKAESYFNFKSFCCSFLTCFYVNVCILFWLAFIFVVYFFIFFVSHALIRLLIECGVTWYITAFYNADFKLKDVIVNVLLLIVYFCLCSFLHL